MNMLKFADYIKEDCYRYIGKTNLKSIIRCYFKYSGFRFSFWLRACFFLRKKRIKKILFFPLARFLYKKYKYKYGIDIPYSCEIGPGLLIYHFGGIVFVPKKAGKNITLSQCTTVGMVVKNGVKEYPEIGDGLYMAPGSKIIGGIKVGNYVAIGTNAVLNKNADDNSVIVGIPGKPISFNGSYSYLNFWRKENEK